MSAFTEINLDKLPAPETFAPKHAETVLSEIKAWLINLETGLAPVLDLESEPIT